jgi:O-antigen ligase
VDSSNREYYSNAEGAQMWRVGLKMIYQHPAFGSSRACRRVIHELPGEGEPVPVYRGHLHDKALQLAAQFGLPVLGAAVLWMAFLLRDLMPTWRTAQTREYRFLLRTSFVGIAGYLIVGVTEYTCGHSLGLILFCFVAISPLILSTQEY